MRKIFLFSIAAISALLTICISSCKNMDNYVEERAEQALLHTHKASNMIESDGKTFTLDDCIKYALKHNLQVRLHELDVAITRENKMAEVMGMLPELNFNENFTARSNTAASSSEKIKTGGRTYGDSSSEERQVNYFNIDLLFSVLDMGLSYWNTEIAQNKMLMHQQRALRVTQNIQLDVVKAYFKVAAAQRAKDRTEKLLDTVRKKASKIRQGAASGRVNPIMSFNVLRKLTSMEKQLTNYTRVYENACVELRTLMGLYPNPVAIIAVDEKCLDSFPSVTLPEIELMEQIALLQRPEMYESDIQREINIMECKKVVLMMFPTVKFYADWTHSSNDYLYHQNWMEVGVRAAYNLLLLPHQLAKHAAYQKQIEADTMRRYAQSVAIMAQVRLSHANLHAARALYEKDKKISSDYNTYLANAEKQLRSRGGRLQEIDVDYMRLESAKAEIDYVLSLGNCYIAYYRLLNAMGILKADFRTIDSCKEELEDARIAAEKIIKKERAQYDDEEVAKIHELKKQEDKRKKRQEELEREERLIKVKAEISSRIQAEKQKTR